jgi:FMN reductase
MLTRRDFVPYIVGIGGTARPRSTTENAVRETLRAAARLGATTRLFDGAFVSSLPLYVPGKSARTEAESELVEAIRQCHGVIVGTPGYHGSLSGPIKNVLDLLEDTARDEQPYLDGRAFGCIVTAAGWQGCGTALVTLRMIAHALRAWPTPFGATLNASTPLFDADGTLVDKTVAHQLSTVASQVVDFARCRAAVHGQLQPDALATA